MFFCSCCAWGILVTIVAIIHAITCYFGTRFSVFWILWILTTFHTPPGAVPRLVVLHSSLTWPVFLTCTWCTTDTFDSSVVDMTAARIEFCLLWVCQDLGEACHNVHENSYTFHDDFTLIHTWLTQFDSSNPLVNWMLRCSRGCSHCWQVNSRMNNLGTTPHQSQLNTQLAGAECSLHISMIKESNSMPLLDSR